MQVRELVDLEPDEPREAWFDVATVTVKVRTKRKGVIDAALKQAGLTPTRDASLTVRVLNGASAKQVPVASESQLLIG